MSVLWKKNQMMSTIKAAYPALILAVLVVLAYYQFNLSHTNSKENPLESSLTKISEAVHSSSPTSDAPVLK